MSKLNRKKISAVFIIAGKNPLAAQSGYAVYAYNLAKLISQLGLKVEIFCLGAEDRVIKSNIGTVHVIGSGLFTFLKGTEMASLALLAPQLSQAVAQRLAVDAQPLIWGIGPWSLAGAILKLIPKYKHLVLWSDYFTSIKHEFAATLSAISTEDYGLLIRLRTVVAYYTIIHFYSWLEKFLLQKSDRIITHYRSTETILSQQFNIKKPKFSRIAYNVELVKRANLFDHHQSAPVFIPPKPLVLLVCRHDGRKGINYLLKALAILNNKGIKYSCAIVGAGPLLSVHQRLATKLALGNVYLLGFVADLRPFFKKADLYVFPSVEEGSSALSILEAMQAGLPIVATQIDGIPEDLKDHYSALLVPPHDPEALAEAMYRLLSNSTLAKKLGQQAKISHQEKYNQTKFSNEIKRLLI